MKEQIRSYLLERSVTVGVTQLADDDSLLEVGVLDSLAMVDLIAHLEHTFGIQVGEDDMIPEHFDSVASIAAYVARKRG